MEKFTSGMSSSSGLDLVLLSSKPSLHGLGSHFSIPVLRGRSVIVVALLPVFLPGRLGSETNPADGGRGSARLLLEVIVLSPPTVGPYELFAGGSSRVWTSVRHGSDSPQADLCSVPPLSLGAPAPGGLTLLDLDMISMTNLHAINDFRVRIMVVDSLIISKKKVGGLTSLFCFYKQIYTLSNKVSVAAQVVR